MVTAERLIIKVYKRRSFSHKKCVQCLNLVQGRKRMGQSLGLCHISYPRALSAGISSTVNAAGHGAGESPSQTLSSVSAWRKSSSSTRTGPWDKTPSVNIWNTMVEKLPLLVCFRSSEILGCITNSEMGHTKSKAGICRELFPLSQEFTFSNQSEAGKTRQEQVLLTITIKKFTGKIK